MGIHPLFLSSFDGKCSLVSAFVYALLVLQNTLALCDDDNTTEMIVIAFKSVMPSWHPSFGLFFVPEIFTVVCFKSTTIHLFPCFCFCVFSFCKMLLFSCVGKKISCDRTCS